jgi:hypothetical protein
VFWPNAIWPKSRLTESPFSRTPFYRNNILPKKVIWPKDFSAKSRSNEKNWKWSIDLENWVIWPKAFSDQESFDRNCLSARGNVKYNKHYTHQQNNSQSKDTLTIQMSSLSPGAMLNRYFSWDLHAKKTFCQTTFRSILNFSFWLNDIFCRKKIRSKDFLLKKIGQMIFRTNGIRSNSDLVKRIFGQTMFSQMAFILPKTKLIQDGWISYTIINYWEWYSTIISINNHWGWWSAYKYDISSVLDEYTICGRFTFQFISVDKDSFWTKKNVFFTANAQFF